MILFKSGVGVGNIVADELVVGELNVGVDVDVCFDVGVDVVFCVGVGIGVDVDVCVDVVVGFDNVVGVMFDSDG